PGRTPSSCGWPATWRRAGCWSSPTSWPRATRPPASLLAGSLAAGPVRLPGTIPGAPEASARPRRPLHACGQSLRGQDAVALGEQLADLGPVDAVAQHHDDDVVAPARLVERMAAADQRAQLVAGGTERHHADRLAGADGPRVGRLVVGVDAQHVGEGARADAPADAHPGRLLVRLRQAEADRPQAGEDLGRHVAGLTHARDATGGV